MLATVKQFFIEEDGVTGRAKLKTADENNYLLERVIQHLYPLGVAM